MVGSDGPRLFSIGHSNQSFQSLVGLLERHRVEVVADVRTSPYSRYSPQFNRRDLRFGLAEAGFRYVFLGKELGGHPEGDFYKKGRIEYGRVAKTDWFQAGLDRLCDGITRFRTAILCSEEDPSNCHRFVLITRALKDRGVEVAHIRGDGAIQRTEEISQFDPEYKEVSLFGEETSSWISTRSVLPKGRPKTSSNR